MENKGNRKPLNKKHLLCSVCVIVSVLSASEGSTHTILSVWMNAARVRFEHLLSEADSVLALKSLVRCHGRVNVHRSISSGSPWQLEWRVVLDVYLFWGWPGSAITSDSIHAIRSCSLNNTRKQFLWLLLNASSCPDSPALKDLNWLTYFDYMGLLLF